MKLKVAAIVLAVLWVAGTIAIDSPKNVTQNSKLRKYNRSRYNKRTSHEPTVILNIENSTLLIETEKDSDTSNDLQSFEVSNETTDQNTTNESLKPVTIEPPKTVAQDCGVRIGEGFPWIAVLEHTDPNDAVSKKTLSKGVLIDEYFVLTTVSSLHNSYPFFAVTAVRFGDFVTWEGTSTKNKSDVIRIEVGQVYLHKKKDIALIKLAGPVEFADHIQPICLANNDNYNFQQLHLHVCKRSKHHNMQERPKNKFISASPLSPNDCNILLKRKKAQFTLDEFCAWDEPGDTCIGDLGSPLIAKESGGRYHVIGLRSFAQTEDHHLDMDESTLPGIYTHVGKFLTWIRKTMKYSRTVNSEINVIV